MEELNQLLKELIEDFDEVDEGRALSN